MTVSDNVVGLKLHYPGCADSQEFLGKIIQKSSHACAFFCRGICLIITGPTEKADLLQEEGQERS